jgi:hypothetical protein
MYDSNLRIVNLHTPVFSNPYSEPMYNFWLNLLDGSLSDQFMNYELKIDKIDSYNIPQVSILFETVEDATLFKLQQKD